MIYLTALGLFVGVVVVLWGINIVLLIKIGENMNELNAAITRLQDSVNKLITKVDTLQAGNNAALVDVTATVNALADLVDSKNT